MQASRFVAVMEIDDSIRQMLVKLARRSNARVTRFSPSLPTDWRPGQVRNPNGVLDDYFTDTAAWNLIAASLESGHLVEVVTLRKPPGRKGYVLHVDLERGDPPIYIKLQLGSGKIIGRSFHYSNEPIPSKD